MLNFLLGRRGRSTLVHLLVASSLAFLPVVAVSSLLLVKYGGSERARLEIETGVKAQNLASVVEQELTAMQVSASVFATSPLVANGEYDKIDAWARKIQSAHGHNLVISTYDGTQLVNTFVPRGQPLRKTAEDGQKTDRTAFFTDAPTFSGVFTGSNAAAPLVNVTVPATCMGRPCAVKLAVLSSHISKLLKQEGIPSDWIGTIVDREYKIVARSINEEKTVGKQVSERMRNAIERLGHPSVGGFNGVTLEGVETYTRFVLLEKAGWYVSIGTPRDLLQEPMRASIRLLLVAVGLVILGGFMLSHGFSNRIVKALDELTRVARDINTDKANIKSLKTPIAEVNDVSEALVRSAESLAAKERALEDAIKRVTILMRETLHRAKNQLTIIQVMSRQTARLTSSVDEFQRKFDERLHGLAQTQSLLVESRWSGITLRDLVTSHMQHYRDDIGTRICISGPELAVLPEPAQNLGLALHELCNNATKYGALSTPEGEVSVTWDVVGGKFMMDWIESGGPAITAVPKHKGFGNIVTRRLVAQAFDGVVTLDYNPTGVHWRLVGSTAYFTAPTDCHDEHATAAMGTMAMMAPGTALTASSKLYAPT